MEMYTTPTRINGAWREVLIYKSETPLTFESLERHTQTDEQGDKTIITTYVTEPYIYRQFEPTEKDSHYYYWFVIKVVERETVTTNGERVADLEQQLSDADNAVIELYEQNEAAALANSEQDAAIIELYELIEGSN